jgi:hypothetical protein
MPILEQCFSSFRQLRATTAAADTHADHYHNIPFAREKVKVSLRLIKHYAMKAYGGVDV